jgi:hypothetical protein
MVSYSKPGKRGVEGGRGYAVRFGEFQQAKCTKRMDSRGTTVRVGWRVGWMVRGALRK